MENAWLAVGLGNPGAKYENSPHNAGVRAVERLSSRLGVTLRPSRAPALVADTQTDGVRLLLARPTTYMNESGRAVSTLLKWFPVGLDHLIVVHDEIDLPLGVLRLKFGGGNAGHHGLDSITDSLEESDFYRVRVGVGRPAGSKDAHVGWLIDRLPKKALEELAVAEEEAADAVISIIHEGLERAMNRYNTPPERRVQGAATDGGT